MSEKKAKKDPNAPKRPTSAYMFFAQDQRSKVIAANPNAAFTEIGSILGQNWKSLSDSYKSPYMAKAEKDKKRYEKEAEAYNAMATAR